MSKIHPSAVIDSGAEIGEDVEIGPFCVVTGHVRIDRGTRLISHVHIDGHTSLGQGCMVYPFACLGTRTQDLKFKGGNPRVEIGEGTVIREYVTVSAATNDGDVTRVGDHCLLMACAHVAHDCTVGNEVIMANCGTLAGHVVIEDQVILGGLSAVHQFVQLGRLCIIGGCSKVTQDVPPFMMADGHPLAVRGVNSVGLKRHGIEGESAIIIKNMYKILYRQQLTTKNAVAKIEETLKPLPEVKHMLEFIGRSERGITKK